MGHVYYIKKTTINEREREQERERERDRERERWRERKKERWELTRRREREYYILIRKSQKVFIKNNTLRHTS